MKKAISAVNSLVWTLAGTALVLITLSGDTRTYGLWISGVALVLNVVGILLEDE